jgi:hypothetical protein
MGSIASLLTHPRSPSTRLLRNYALLYTFLTPCLLGFALAGFLSQLGMDVNWLKLALYLFLGIVMSSTFSIGFGIAFLLPFSLMSAVASSTALNLTSGIIFSLMLGLAYGLNPNRAAWGLTASVVYGIAFAMAFGLSSGVMIGAAFFIGYFRIIFFLMEAPFAWGLAYFADSGNALDLWRINPVVWDELIWFPLPGLGRHLLALKRQNETAARDAILCVQSSFHQGKIAKRIPL